MAFKEGSYACERRNTDIMTQPIIVPDKQA